MCSFPYKIGYDCAGTVVDTGAQVTRFKAGDEVFVRLPECQRGSWSELARSTEEFVALKPKGLSMEDAASIPLASMTALQALRGYEGNLEGKTLFIPAGRKIFCPKFYHSWVLTCHSGWHRAFCLPASKEYFQSRQSDHHGFHRQSTQGEGASGRGCC